MGRALLTDPIMSAATGAQGCRKEARKVHGEVKRIQVELLELEATVEDNPVCQQKQKQQQQQQQTPDDELKKMAAVSTKVEEGKKRIEKVKMENEEMRKRLESQKNMRRRLAKDAVDIEKELTKHELKPLDKVNIKEVKALGQKLLESIEQMKLSGNTNDDENNNKDTEKNNNNNSNNN